MIENEKTKRVAGAPSAIRKMLLRSNARLVREDDELRIKEVEARGFVNAEWALAKVAEQRERWHRDIVGLQAVWESLESNK